MEKNQLWEISVILSIRDRGEDFVDLLHIYDGIEDYRKLTQEDQKITYDQPNFHHTVRSTLARLKTFGVVGQKGRGIYCLTQTGKDFLFLFEKGVSWERIDKDTFWQALKAILEKNTSQGGVARTEE
jgi:predicted transcriptional regulator